MTDQSPGFATDDGPGFSADHRAGLHGSSGDDGAAGGPVRDQRAERRAADLLPEERTVGSADPQAQAEAILEESDEREADQSAAPDSFLDHRTSAQTVTPGEDTR